MRGRRGGNRSRWASVTLSYELISRVQSSGTLSPYQFHSASPINWTGGPSIIVRNPLLDPFKKIHYSKILSSGLMRRVYFISHKPAHTHTHTHYIFMLSVDKPHARTSHTKAPSISEFIIFICVILHFVRHTRRTSNDFNCGSRIWYVRRPFARVYTADRTTFFSFSNSYTPLRSNVYHNCDEIPFELKQKTS